MCRLILPLALVMFALTTAAVMLGRALPPSPLLAYLLPRNYLEYPLEVLEVSRQFRVPLDRSTNFMTWSADGQLTFVSLKNVNAEIFTWDTENGIRNISQSAAQDSQPAWSRDGRLAFISNRTGRDQVYVLERNGTVRSVTNNRQNYSRPLWSPGGRLLLHTRRGFEVIELSGESRVFTDPDWAVAMQGAWAADDTLALLKLTLRGAPVVTIITPEGDQRSFFPPAQTGTPFDLHWMPDGRLAVAINPNRNPTSIMFINPANGAQQVIDLQTQSTGLYWSPTGRVAFANYQGTTFYDVNVLETDGTIRPLVQHTAYDEPAGWTDDDRLIFRSNRAGDFDLYLLQPGGEIHRLTHTPAQESSAAWFTP